jgi:23S rRNA (adenine2503-C2)-methyltransferase
MQKFQNSLSNTEIREKSVLSGMDISEIALLTENLGTEKKLPPYRAKQIFSWIHRGRAQSFEDMTSIPQDLRKTLEKHALISECRIQKILEDKDGTIKLILDLTGGLTVEAVLLAAEAKRYTACLSTQAGCPMGCIFCKTGSLGYYRNLGVSEIVEQFLFLANILAEKSELSCMDKPPSGGISNIVVMGMGEPLLNLPALRKALEILCNPYGFGVSKRKITVSTSGIYEGIVDLAENGPETELALSIASAREDLRRRLMPGTAKYPLAKLKEALTIYRKKQGRRITLEIVLLGGINTLPEDAQALIDFTKNLDTVVNLIPWNPVKDLYFDGKKLQQPKAEELNNFKQMLECGGLSVTRRYRRGRGISGACGQLG